MFAAYLTAYLITGIALGLGLLGLAMADVREVSKKPLKLTWPVRS